MAFFHIPLNGNFHENLCEKFFDPFCRTFLTNRGKNKDEDEKIGENQFNFWIFRIRIGFYGNFQENPRKNILTHFSKALSGLRQFLAEESSLKIMKNAFYFTLKAVFVLKLFKLLSWLFGHVWKWLDHRDKVNFETYDITTWLTNSCNKHIAQCLKK